MIDRVYKTVQAIGNKEQLGYIKPMKFNLYVNNSINKIYNKLIIDVKANVRKSNSMLDGKNMADFSDKIKQLLEYFYMKNVVSLENGLDVFLLPEDCEYLEDLYTYEDVRIEKADGQDFNLLKRNGYASPNGCSPIYNLFSRTIEVVPKEIEEVKIDYIRRPLLANWTYEEEEEKPMFDPTKQDFQEIDLPEVFFNDIVNSVLAQVGITIRDNDLATYANQEENEDFQIENKQ